MDRYRISLCMMVKNEAANLARCLDSVKGLADEIVIADTGSTDDTPGIAAGYGAVVLPFDFTIPDFSAARNYALDRARGRWILVLDADEILEPASARLVERLAALDENVGFHAERHNHAVDGCTIDYPVRFFSNRPDYRYRGRVHETVDASIMAGGGRLIRSGIVIGHNFAPDRESRRRRNHWYIDILMQEITANPADHSRLDFLAAEYHQLEMFDAAAEVTELIAWMRPRDYRAHLKAGIYHLVYQSDPARARADFRRVLEIRPGDPEAVSYLETIEKIGEKAEGRATGVSRALHCVAV